MREEQRFQKEHVNGAFQQNLAQTKAVWAETYANKYASPEELARLQVTPPRSSPAPNFINAWSSI